MQCKSMLLRCKSGSAAVEFALLSPLLIAVVLGILCYGGYFWIAHAVQQTANDGARAAVAGLDSTERSSLAQESVRDSVDDYGFLEVARTTVTTTELSGRVSVTVAFDASQTPFWSFGRLLPMPSSTVSRTASVRLGGY
jgi:Flp pilus assembly protein TadG